MCRESRPPRDWDCIDDELPPHEGGGAWKPPKELDEGRSSSQLDSGSLISNMSSMTELTLAPPAARNRPGVKEARNGNVSRIELLPPQ